MIYIVYSSLSISFRILHFLSFFISCNWQKRSYCLNKATLATNWIGRNQNNLLLSDCSWLEPRTTYFLNEHSTIRPNWPNHWALFWVLISMVDFNVCSCLTTYAFPWHSGNYRVWIHSETRTWHDKNIQSL